MYSIQDVSNKTGLSTHTLRYYEKEGLISGVERRPACPSRKSPGLCS